MTAEEIDQALRRVVAEAQLEDSFRLRGRRTRCGRAAWQKTARMRHASVRLSARRSTVSRQGKAASLAALRRSPLVGADLDLARPREKGRKVRI